MSNLKIYDDRQKLWVALAEYSQSLSRISTEEAPVAYEIANDLLKLADDVKERLRTRLLEYTQLNGEKKGDKGTYEANIGEKVVRCIPTRTGVDPKLLEGMLRAKGFDPNTNMMPTVTYKVDYEKLNDLVATGRLSVSDVEACRYDKAYRVEVRGPRGE